MPAPSLATDQIVITASRTPEDERRTAASATIVDRVRIARLGEPLAPALLRLAPSTAIATQGPSGLLTEVRIRGAENNHTLLFIDGIRANDPATGDFARFELLNTDLASRIEIVRGPQSALWGSQAVGGVIAINGADEPAGRALAAEAGSFGFRRASASGSIGDNRANLSGGIGWQRANGIDSFSGDGDRDGYRNLSARLRGTVEVTPAIRLGASALALTGKSEFDGYDLTTFERADTGDISKNRLAAARIWGEFDEPSSPWSGGIGATLLGSSNNNKRDGAPVNRTSGTRRALDVQIARAFTTGPAEHRLIAAFDAERETFRARDTVYFGATDQDRDRTHKALTGEWRASAGRWSADVAIRRDMFNRFKDATSVRTSILADVGNGFALAGSYSEGIAQPTFFDLYGFFPGDFVGNPDLRAEESRGFEGSLRFRRPKVAASLTAYRQRLRNEIVDNATFTSTVNSEGTSRRWGVEADFAWLPIENVRLTGHYAYLKSTQPDGAVNEQLEEWRRPRHSGSIAADGSAGRWSYGGTLAYVGSHLDRQEVAPFAVVRLDPYLLMGARVAYAVTNDVEVFARGSNVLDSEYEDSAGYRTEGRGLFVGIRLADRRSSP